MARIERQTTKHILKEGSRLYTHYRVVESKRVQGCKYPQKIILEFLGTAEGAIAKLERSTNVPQSLKTKLREELVAAISSTGSI